MKRNILSKQAVRFGIVGIFNTGIDFGLLFFMRWLGASVIGANIISTGTAFIFSFFANKKYAFRSTNPNVLREATLFILVTLFGLWVIQTVIIQVVIVILGDNFSDQTTLLIAKLVATVASLLWNYSLYSRVVFKKQ